MTIDPLADVAALTSAGGLVGGGTVFVLLLALIIRLLRQNTADREQYRQHVALVQKEGAERAAASAEEHRQTLVDLRDEIAAVRGELREVREELEAERAARWKAQDDAAGYRRELELIRKGAPS